MLRVAAGAVRDDNFIKVGLGDKPTQAQTIVKIFLYLI